MSSPLFDTLDAAEALTGAGPTEAQAKAIVAAMRKAVSDNVATKGDVAELRGELGAVKAELKGDIGAVKAELWAVKRVLGFVLAIVPAMAARLFGVLWRSPPAPHRFPAGCFANPLRRPRRGTAIAGVRAHG